MSKKIKLKVLCEKHLHQENLHFDKGKKLLARGDCNGAIRELSKVSELNPNYIEAKRLIKFCKDGAVGEFEREQMFLTVRGFERMLPDSLSGYKLESRFIEKDEGAEFLAGRYSIPSKEPLSLLEVCVYRLRSSYASSKFVTSLLDGRYPSRREKVYLNGAPVYLGCCEPYCAACASYKNFAFEVTAFYKGDYSKIRSKLLEICSELLENSGSL